MQRVSLEDYWNASKEQLAAALGNELITKYNINLNSPSARVLLRNALTDEYQKRGYFDKLTTYIVNTNVFSALRSMDNLDALIRDRDASLIDTYKMFVPQ